MRIERFEDLECWKEARNLVRMVYESVNANPGFQRDFRLSGQITGAALSVMNNIAEGWASQSNAEFIRFLTYSRRSCAETQNCCYVALDELVKSLSCRHPGARRGPEPPEKIGFRLPPE